MGGDRDRALPAARGDPRRAPRRERAAGAGRARSAWSRRSRVPMLLVYAIAPEPVLRLAFGEDTVVAADALFVLGLAMTLLAVCYLCVQYMLALGRLAFLLALAVVAGAEIVAARRAGDRVPAHRSRRSCWPCRRPRRCPCSRSGCWRRSGDPRPRRERDRGLADRGAGGSAWRRARRGPRARSSRSARSAGAPRSCWRGPPGRSSPSTRTRGGDRGPQEIAPDAALRRRRSRSVPRQPGGGGRRRPGPPRAQARPPRRTADVYGQIALLFVDGAHRFGPARDDVAHWGARVAPGGTMLVHDAFSSIGVTARAVHRLRGLARRGATPGARAAWPSTSAARRRGSYPERAVDAAAAPRGAAVVRPQRGDQGARAGRAAAVGGAARARPGRAMALLSARISSVIPATATQWTAIRSIAYSGL